MKQFRLGAIMMYNRNVVVVMVSGCGTLSKKKETAIGCNIFQRKGVTGIA